MAKRLRSTKTTYDPPAKRFKRDENALKEYHFENIPQLNDDCLREIFSYLPVKDLCAIRDCSIRFCALAEATVQKMWQKRNRTEYVVEIVGDDDDEPLTLTKFGHLISHLIISDPVFSHTNDVDIRSAFECCTSLKTLNLKLVDLSLIPFDILKTIDELKLYSCIGDDWLHLKIINACETLKHLKLLMNPKEHLLTAINQHSNIESVSWEVYGAENSTFVDVKNLYKLKKLKKLVVHGYQGYTFKGLSLSYRFPQVTETIKFLARSSSLEELNISYFDPDNYFFKALNRFTSLKCCVLSTYVKISDANLAFATNFETEKRNGCGFLQCEYVITPKQKNSN